MKPKTHSSLFDWTLLQLFPINPSQKFLHFHFSLEKKKNQKETSLMFKQLQVWQREVENWWHTTFTTSASVDAEQLCSSNVKHWRDDVIKNFILFKTAHMLWNMLEDKITQKWVLIFERKCFFFWLLKSVLQLLWSMQLQFG